MLCGRWSARVPDGAGPRPRASRELRHYDCTTTVNRTSSLNYNLTAAKYDSDITGEYRRTRSAAECIL
jgi:hypothetical protein